MLFLPWKTDQNNVLQYIQMLKIFWFDLTLIFFPLSEEPRTNSISEVELSFSQMWLKALEQEPFLHLKWKYYIKHVQLLNLQMVVEEEANER